MNWTFARSSDILTHKERVAATWPHYIGSLIDVAILVLFLALSLIIYYARGGFSSTVTDLTSDAATIATMAASGDFPEHFRQDSVFKRPDVSRFYVAFHVPATRLLYRFTGDYGLAFTVLLLPTLFLYFTAFYFLGYSLFQSRVLALMLAIVNMVLVKGPRDTAWGPFKDALPRFDHAVLFAVLVALLWRLRDRPWLWWLVLLLAGLGVYVHPVSTPALGAMLLGAAVGISLSRQAFLRDLPAVLLAGAAFLLAVFPFAVPFVLTSFGRGIVSAVTADEAAELARIIEERFTGAYLSPSKTIQEYVFRPYVICGIVPLMAGGFLATYLANEQEICKLLRRFAIGAVLGLTLAAILVPVAFEWTTKPLTGFVFKGELPRAARYIVPWTYIIVLAGVGCLWRSLRPPQRRVLIAGILSIIGVGVLVTLPRLSRMVKAMQRVPHANSQVVELVNAIKKDVQPQEPIVAAMTDPLVIRYSALRSLAFATKDVPSTMSLREAEVWRENARTYRRILNLQSFDHRIIATIDWAKTLGARVIVVERPASDNKEFLTTRFSNTQLVFYNWRFALIRLTTEQEDIAVDHDPLQ